MAAVVIRDVEKAFGSTKVIHGINIDIADGEFVVLVGPSGCGKSTLLRMVAGLEEISGGSIAIGAREVNNLPPKERDVAMVFQNYALYPHMTVYDLSLIHISEPAIRRSSSSTSRCPTSTPSCASPCAPRSRRCTSASRPRPST